MGICPGGKCPGVSVQGGICPGGKCPGGYMSGGKCLGVYVQGGGGYVLSMIFSLSPLGTRWWCTYFERHLTFSNECLMLDHVLSRSSW